MARNLLIDTDILIDYLKARDEAVTFLESQLQPLYISTITVAELYAGVRDGKEKVILDDFIEAFIVVPITVDIAIKGGLIRRDYGKSYGVGLADSMIASTAEIKKVSLVTLNQRHYPMIKNLLVPYHK